MTHTSLQATTTFEVEITVSGTISPGRPATPPSYSQGGLPAEPTEVADVEIVGVGIVSRVVDKAFGKFRWQTISILDGVNVSSPDIQKLFANILAQVGEDADAALLAEYSEAA